MEKLISIIISGDMKDIKRNILTSHYIKRGVLEVLSWMEKLMESQKDYFEES